MLETKSKFDIQGLGTDSIKEPLTAREFGSWSNFNMYRTSYKDMYSKVFIY